MKIILAEKVEKLNEEQIRHINDFDKAMGLGEMDIAVELFKHIQQDADNLSDILAEAVEVTHGDIAKITQKYPPMEAAVKIMELCS